MHYRLEVVFAELAGLAALQGLAEEVALGQQPEIVRACPPETLEFVGVQRAEVDLPEILEHLVAVQAHFIGFVEVLHLWPGAVEAAVQVQQVGVVLVGGTKALDHQLGQGQ